ncbi:hypothetical protein ACFQPA_02610 [Halomarina halobia]|uniref:Uncharacterized protein n=1 Tax=Halomarina halobia TaxID=3033386 RepID=A0ABD6A3X1_9EURY|nr:hypothetical protein [Halomarina sp. PSR21]
MDTLVGGLAFAAVVLELVGVVGLAVAGLTVSAAAALWAAALGLILVARIYERVAGPFPRPGRA